MSVADWFVLVIYLSGVGGAYHALVPGEKLAAWPFVFFVVLLWPVILTWKLVKDAP